MQVASSTSMTTILHGCLKGRCGDQEKQRNPYYHINNALMCLSKQERLYSNVVHNTSIKYQIMSLKLGLKFLEVFLKYSADSTLQMHIGDVLYYVNVKLHSLNSLWGRFRRKTLILHLERVYADLQKRMKSIIEEKESRHYYIIGPECTCLLFVDSLLETLYSLHNSNTNLLSPLIKQFSDLRENLMFLESFFVSMEFLSRDKYSQVEILLNYLLIYAVAFVDRATCVVYSSLVGEINFVMVQRVNARFSALNVNPDLAGALRSSTSLLAWKSSAELELDPTNGLLVLLDSLAGSAGSMDSPARKVYDELKSFSNVLTDLPIPLKKEKLNYLIMSIVSITSKALIIMNSRYREKVQAMNNDANGLLLDLVDEIRYVKMRARAREFNAHSTPMVDGLGFWDSFLGNLKELLRCGTEDIEPLKHLISRVHAEFENFRHFMSEIEEHCNLNEELQDPWRQIMSLAYQVEYDIDSFLVKRVEDKYIMSSIPTIIERVNLVKSELQDQHGKLTFDNGSHNVVRTSHFSSNDKLATEVIVGFEAQATEILGDLLGVAKPLSIVSIIGMPGLGKTTMAKKLYNDPYVCEHFYVRAWCCVSQTYQKRQLLLDILDDLVKFPDEIYKKSDEELAELIYRLLRGQRYLIVVDDLWDIQAWDLLNRSLPDDHNCSRIVITSRLANVATLSNKVHNLRPLSDADSWELLQQKLFGTERCPPELSDVGQQIAKSCKGLPLGVSVTSGLLAVMDKILDKWKQIAGSLNSLILSDPRNQVMNILELSYKHLPGHLKSCFLYFGVFPEDREIPVRQLKRLWMAEGFVQNLDSRCLDDLAEDFLMDLIGRSLIIPSKERSQGGVKTCHIHDLLRDFCLAKAEEDKFLAVIYTQNFSNYSKVYAQQRLSISYNVSYTVEPNPDWSNVRSLLYNSHIATLTEDISFITKNSLLLRVLDLGYVTCESVEGIESLIHLRYLAVQARITEIPTSISNLWNLQTFMFRAESGYNKDVIVPASIWNMVKMKHLHIDYSAAFCLPNGNFYVQDTLETLSTPTLCFGEDAENLLRCFPNLKKLRCIYLDSFDDSEECNLFPVLEFLHQLMSLKVCYKGSLLRFKCKFNFPLNLRKLTLANFWLPWDEISSIGRKLPNLTVLKLTNDAASGQIWNMEEGNFPKLKYLELNIVVLVEWKCTGDSLPCLERLVVQRCTTLTEIPPCLADIPTLRTIMVQRCKPSVDESARNILREHRDGFANEDLKVYIYPKTQE